MSLQASNLAARGRMGSAVAKLFYGSVILILLATAALKIISLGLGGPSLRVTDPVLFFLSTRVVMVCAAAVEVFVVVALLYVPLQFRALMIVWLCSVFICYRLGLRAVDYDGPCPCLGHAFSWLGADWRRYDTVSLGLLAYLTFGSVFLLLKKRVPSPAASYS
jgi:hypothetical protein